MVLRACTECGGKVSGDAASCPHCGHPLALSEAQWRQEDQVEEVVTKAFAGAGLGCFGAAAAVVALLALGFGALVLYFLAARFLGRR